MESKTRKAAPEAESSCLSFTLWIEGKKFHAAALAGTAVTIGSGSRVIGLCPTLSADDPKHVSVALLSMKSHEDDVAKGKEVARIDTAFGQKASFEPTQPIRFIVRRCPCLEKSRQASARRRLAPRLPKGPGGGTQKCCVQLPSGNLMCATCYIDLREYGSCCTTIYCCAQMIWNRL